MSVLHPVRHGDLGSEGVLTISEGGVTVESSPASVVGLRDLVFDSTGVERLFYKFPRSLTAFKTIVGEPPLNNFVLQNISNDQDFILEINMVTSEIDLSILTWNTQDDLNKEPAYTPNQAFFYSTSGSSFPRDATFNLPLRWSMGNPGAANFVPATPGDQFFGLEFLLAATLIPVPSPEKIIFPHWPRLKIIL